jgi:hypothetical protein
MLVDIERILIDTIQKLPSLNPVDSRLVLSDVYETSYKLHNHLIKNKSRPLVSIAMHEAEDIDKGGDLEEAIKSFAKRNVKETFGLNFLEYLNQPRHVCNLLSEAALEELKLKNQAMKNVTDGLENKK